MSGTRDGEVELIVELLRVTAHDVAQRDVLQRVPSPVPRVGVWRALRQMDHACVRRPEAEAILNEGGCVVIREGMDEERIRDVAGAIRKVAACYAA